MSQQSLTESKFHLFVKQHQLIFRKQKPFWFATIPIVIANIATLFFLVLEYEQDWQWQYLVLNGTIATMLIICIGGWWLVYAHDNIRYAVTMIVTAQFVTQIVVSFLIADYWLIGLMTLLIVPFEIGVAYRSRRTLLYTILTLLGIAVIITADIFEPVKALTFFHDFPQVTTTIIIFFVIDLLFLIFLLWYFRLRKTSPYHIPLELVTQLSFLLIVTSTMSVIIVTSVLLIHIRSSQIQQIGIECYTNVSIKKVTNSTKIAVLVGVSVMGIVLMIAMITARMIVQPIKNLTRVACLTEQEYFDEQVIPAGSAEMITLAETFNTLTNRINGLVEGLENKVVERTVELQELNNQLKSELHLAHEIQQGLLPPPNPKFPHVEVICYSVPAREVGGDFYDYHIFDLPRNSNLIGKYAFAVGDVLGKGVSAALLMAASLAQLDACLTQDLSPSKRLVFLDKVIEPYSLSHRQNCALCYMEVEIRSQESEGVGHDSYLRVANAGCIPPYIKRVNGSVEWCKVGGFALGQGLGSKFGYPELQVSLAKGDMIILISDGVVEATADENTIFGYDRLQSAIEAAPSTNPKSMLKYILTEVDAFVGEAEPSDDSTIVIVQL
ncbi:MAG: hypothetical protein B6242_01055 [Anaerolineaceae bacterium 4572_78]|nr:MAG: hypothetical protein B6242_01055 [Anaerolineaceae bacterium 4572_78]